MKSLIDLDVPSSQRVPLHTSEEVQERIWNKTIEDVALFVNNGRELINKRLKELEYEWDVEKMLEANAAVFSLTGLLLSFKNRKWMLLPVAVSYFLLQHAITGWCPPLTLFRNMGVRTRKEIEQERNALKRIRGDFGKFETQEQEPLKIAEILLNTQNE